MVEVGGRAWRLVKVTSTLLHHPPPTSTIPHSPDREQQNQNSGRYAPSDHRPHVRGPRREQPPGEDRPQHRSRVIHAPLRSEEHTSELQSQFHLVCRLLLEKKKKPN